MEFIVVTKARQATERDMADRLAGHVRMRGHTRVVGEPADFSIAAMRGADEGLLTRADQWFELINYPDRLVVRWVAGDQNYIPGPSTRGHDWDTIYRLLARFLDAVEQREEARRTAVAELAMAVEVFVEVWKRVAPTLDLNPSDRRVGEALVMMTNEVVKADEPPRSVLREAFHWFAHKADLFAESFAESAGKTAGATAGVAIGAAGGAAMVLGTAELQDAAHRVLDALK